MAPPPTRGGPKRDLRGATDTDQISGMEPPRSAEIAAN